MRITDLEVDDPRQRGLWEDPIVRIKVDENVEEIDNPIFDHKASSEYRLIPCGPFYAPEYRPDTRLIIWDDLYDHMPKATYGELNKLALIREQLHPVWVFTPGGDELPLAMEVPRLRRLLRKYGGKRWGYRVIVDEEAALRGLLKWRLESPDPMCYGGAQPRLARCLADPIQTIVYKETHLPLCRRHLDEHSSRIRQARLTLAP